MTAMDVIGELAKQRVVEQMVLRYTHRRTLSYDLMDLCQMIYVSLMEMPSKVLSMHKAGELEPYIGGMIRNQVSSNSSQYYYTIIRPSKTDQYNENGNEEED